ncbi:DUF317 domain-containing protein [Streptomyces sp. bgisy060]|uniref:DUF317 domain-containing protein n=1 Tax=Streptomyces sp. bgisy060 TaxID=3413775 RepID=UPI003EB6F93E
MLDSRQLDAYAAEYEAKLGSPISPRYLAGPGDARHVTHPLRAAGWSVHSDALHSAVKMKSPDLQHEVLFRPSPHSTRDWWRIHSALGVDYWYATFSGETPAEIIAGLTDTLVRPDPGDAAVDDIPAVLAQHGWTHTRDESGGLTLTSPDGMAVVEQPVSPSLGIRDWEISVAQYRGPYGPEGVVWLASLDQAAPARLLAGVATALADPTPVLRPRFEISERPQLRVGLEVDVGPRIVTAHRKRIAEARRQRPTPPARTAGTVPGASLAPGPARRR